MQNEEAKRLKRLLKTRLTPQERGEVLRQLRDVERPTRQHRPKLSKYALGTWDREPADAPSEATPEPATTPSKPTEHAPESKQTEPSADEHKDEAAASPQLTAEELTNKLVPIKDQLDLLSRARITNPCSLELAQQSERLREVWQGYAEQLKVKDLTAYLQIIADQGWLVAAIQKIEKPTIPAKLQELAELRWQIYTEPDRRDPPRGPNDLPDGFGPL